MEKENLPQKEKKKNRISLLKSAEIAPSLGAEEGNRDISREYSSDVEQFQLLTKEEETKYGTEIQDGLKAEAALAELANGGQNSDAEYVRELKAKIKRGEAAQEIMVRSNLRLVVFVANQVSAHPDIMDAIQAGNMGLVRAVRAFDPSRDNRFSTYAVWWIRQSIFRQESTTAYSVRLPAYAHGICRQIRAIENRAALDNKVLSDKEIAKQLNCTEETVSSLRSAIQSPLYLHQKRAEEEDPLIDWIAWDPGTQDPIDEIWRKQTVQTVDRVLNKFLSERERYVIKRRFGACGEVGPCTLEQIAETMGVTRERVRQIEKNAMGKLRRSGEAKRNLMQLLQEM